MEEAGRCPEKLRVRATVIWAVESVHGLTQWIRVGVAGRMSSALSPGALDAPSVFNRDEKPEGDARCPQLSSGRFQEGLSRLTCGRPELKHVSRVGPPGGLFGQGDK